MNNHALEAKRAYMREWRRKNPDKVKASMERYWTRRAEREAAEREREKALEVNQDEQTNS